MPADPTYSETPFDHPVLLLRQFRDFIFGSQKPELMIRLCCYLQLLIWLLFTLWHAISYAAISLSAVILEEKKIDVELLIAERGKMLGFGPDTFEMHLLHYHLVALACWAIVFTGIVLAWRKKQFFLYFLLGGGGCYYLALFQMLGLQYYNEDTTLFDKVSFAILIGNTMLLYLLIRHIHRRIPKFWLEEEV